MMTRLARPSTPASMPASASRRRGSVIVVVLWSLGIAAVIGTALQVFAFRAANLGGSTLQEIQARWAARAGVENMIATLALNTEEPYPDDAFAIVRDLDAISFLELGDAAYEISHHSARVDVNGPFDESSKVNFNRQQPFLVYELMDDITPDQIEPLIDWTDEDDEPGLFGAEADYYLAQGLYQPRNGPFRSLAEMELVAGVWPEFVRGEDSNLNSRRDANEDDRARTLPDDNGDGWLNGEWSRVLTVSSLDDGATDSGFPRIHLKRADPIELQDRLGVDELQAERLIAFGRNEANELWQLIGLPLAGIDDQGNVGAPGGDPETPQAAPLDDLQLRAVLAECTMRPLFDRRPGRVNINTAAPELVRDICEFAGFDESVADELLFVRNGTPEGFTSEIQFADIRADVTPEDIQLLASIFGVRSNVYRISSVGRSFASGTEVEIICLVDRSTVPVRILEYRER
jgi:hypothetical protein